MFSCVCLILFVCLLVLLCLSDCSCSRRGWPDQPTSGPSGVRELHYASSSHLPIIIIIIIITNFIKIIIIIPNIIMSMVIVIVLSSSKLPLDTSWDQASKNSSTNEPIVFLAWLFFFLATWLALCFTILFNSGRRLFIVKLHSRSTASLILMLTDLIPQSGTVCIVSVFVFVFMPPFCS